MSAILVCLRSRLLSEAVADLVGSRTDLEVVPIEPEDVGSAIKAVEHLGGLLVDGVSAGLIEEPGSCPVVVLGRREQDAGGLDGVVAHLAIDVGSEDLIEALRALAAGELEIETRAVRSVGGRRRADDRSEWLTPRESEVLEHLAAASTPADIAAALDVSEHTVRTHVQNLLAKLGASSKVDAVARARSLGLLDAGRQR